MVRRVVSQYCGITKMLPTPVRSRVKQLVLTFVQLTVVRLFHSMCDVEIMLTRFDGFLLERIGMGTLTLVFLFHGTR